jgi:hypothetical protein
MEFLKKNPKIFQWLFLLIVFFALCFAIEVPETYKFIRGQAEFIKDPCQMAKCPATKPLVEATMPLTLSSLRRVLGSMSHDVFLWIWSQQL